MSQDLDKLQGAWSIAELKMDGFTLPGAMLGSARVVITGDRFVSSGMGTVYEGVATLNPDANPATIDIKFDAGPEKGNTNFGIYRIDATSWQLCLATRGSKRPTSFSSSLASGVALQTLVRPTDPSPVDSPAKPATQRSSEFEGEWKLVSAVMDGKPMDESMVAWVKRVTKGNETTVMAGPQTMLKVEFTVDASTTPRSIDYLNLAGGNKGKKQLGIYKNEGGLLTFCVAPPDAGRPTDFQSVPGDGRTLTVWK